MENTTKYQQVAKPYRVLSLDGGGMRGVYTAAFLARLTDQFGRIRSEPALDLGRGFDLITGTSTGAIVGCALAVGRPMSEIIDLYRKHGRKIFPHRIAGGGSAIFRVTQGSRYVRTGDKALRKALEAVLSDTTMLDVYRERGISLCVPAVLMSEHRAWVFKKTPRSGVRDENYPLVDVCMATSAAPIYRSLAAIDDPNSSGGPKQVFADGGLWANNPILVGLVDALTIAAPDRPIEIFSLGTCPRPVGDHFDAGTEHRSMLDWSLGADVAPLSISAQEFAFDHMARLLANAINSCGRPIRKVRFPNKPVPASMMPFLGLDDTRPEAMDRLIAQAHTDADLTKSVCDDSENEDGKMIRRLMYELPAMPASGAVWDRVSENNAGGRVMIDCAKDVRAYHNQDVTLPESEQKGMRDRRNANRTRLRKGLDEADKPAPIEFVKQGSYAMKTMIRDPDNDYDIDDGVYFRKEDLVGGRGAEMTSLNARQMVRDAVDDGKFKQAPEVRSNCVQVLYKAGYHVDLPVYRRVVTSTTSDDVTHYELAASSGWKRSDARDVSKWYEDERAKSDDSQQLRRINRYLKKYARSRQSWRSGILSGFGISVLVVERFRHHEREDRALYGTMVAIRDRLDRNLEVLHPVTPGDYITSGADDARARSFREKLTDAIDALQPLFDSDCTRERALECWDKVFATTFFSERHEDEKRASMGAPAIVSSAAILSSTATAAAAVSSAGGGRHA